ncbi:TorF family putative porin [Pseudoroseomonas globiformis]|uniref:TorF family putative porin n=1 Tax=Teichococcus globiformis TaxID=2307229 RepID=A0ABV7G6C0_9PROT
MTILPRLAATFCLGLAVLSAPGTGRPATALELGDSGLTLTATPAIASDYLFRGISQTRGRPAMQLTLDLQHESGLYIGAFGTNVAFYGSNARQEVDLLAGYRFAVGDASLDLGGIFYTYPGYDAPQGGYDYNYFELVAKGSYTLDPVKFLGTAAWSPEFYYESGGAVYLEAGADVTLPLDFTLSGRWGYQFIDRNPRYGAPDYANWSVAVSREVFAGFMLSVGYYDTSLSKNDCFAGTKLCDARALVMLSRPF